MSQLKDGYIKYSNEEERQAAIKYAESLGFKEWPSNRRIIINEYNAIFIDTNSKEWHDSFYEGNNEIPLNTKDYTDSETNCKGCMRPCGECEIDAEYKDEAEFYMKPLNLYKHDFEATKDVPLVTIPIVGTFFNIDPDKYTKTESKDGTITLKPKKKVKVWITTWLNEYRDIEILKSCDENHYTLLLESKQKMNWTLIEIIEREYEL